MASAPGTLLTSVRSFNEEEEEGEDEGGVKVQIKRRDSSSWIHPAPEAVSCLQHSAQGTLMAPTSPNFLWIFTRQTDRSQIIDKSFGAIKRDSITPAQLFRVELIVVGRHRVFGGVNGS